jgi:hypothetical protein
MLCAFLQDRFYRLTEGGARNVNPGMVFIDFYDFTTLTLLLGSGSMPRDVLDAVREAAKDRFCIPDEMKLDLKEDPRGDRIDLMIVFAKDEF